MKILNEVQGHSQLHGKFEASLGQGLVIKKKKIRCAWTKCETFHHQRSRQACLCTGLKGKSSFRNFILAPHWKQPTRPSTDEQVDSATSIPWNPTQQGKAPGYDWQPSILDEFKDSCTEWKKLEGEREHPPIRFHLYLTLKCQPNYSKRKEILEYEAWSRKDKSNSSRGETPKGTRTCLRVTEMSPNLMVLKTSRIYTHVSKHIKLYTYVLYIVCQTPIKLY